VNASETSIAVSFFSEILTVEQLLRNRLGKVLPKGMELSHFSVLNHLAYTGAERTPAQLAKTFHLSRGAITNTLSKLEAAGYIHVRPDWDDARRKMVSISPSGRSATEAAIHAITPMVSEAVRTIGKDKVRTPIPVMRELRRSLTSKD